MHSDPNHIVKEKDLPGNPFGMDRAFHMVKTKQLLIIFNTIRRPT
jgi:hypothetical protein